MCSHHHDISCQVCKKYGLQNIFSMNTFLRYLSNGKAYQDSIKGLLCSMTNITNVIQDEDLKIKISRKPKLLNLSLVFVFMGLLNFYFYSALKQRFSSETLIKVDIIFTLLRRFHAIPKVDWNLLDIKLQSLFVNLMIVEVILDQVRNTLIQSYYEQLGLENAFLCWWLSFYFENMGMIFWILFKMFLFKSHKNI